MKNRNNNEKLRSVRFAAMFDEEKFKLCNNSWVEVLVGKYLWCLMKEIGGESWLNIKVVFPAKHLVAKN